MGTNEYEAFFASNDIQQVASNIKRKVEEFDIFPIEYPICNPLCNIGMQYSVIGRNDAHKRISKILKEQGYGCRKICNYLYVFYKKNCSKERLENAVADAYRYAHWMDMID